MQRAEHLNDGRAPSLVEGPASEDAALLARYAAGDLAAARALADRHLRRVLGFARRMLGDAAEAEDVAQEAMLRLWQTAPRWRAGEARVSTWLYRVTANLCTDRLRRHRTVALDETAEAPDPAPGALAAMMAADRAAALEAALALLPPRQRQAVVLRHLEGLGNPEIALVMDIGVEAVESLIARGRRALAARLAPRREELGLDDDIP
jgi:RNA polymerase sigma-70 factor (ECF subfamily)